MSFTKQQLEAEVRHLRRQLKQLELTRGIAREQQPITLNINERVRSTDRAKWWSVKDPAGKPYQFVDLMQFIRTHKELFNEVDLLERLRGKTRANYKWSSCNAYFGLASLRPGLKNTKPIWKGWTWHYDNP